MPESESVMVSADYSQLELRVAAALSGDQQLHAVFQHPPDSPEGNAHAVTTAMLFSVPVSEAKQRPALYHVGKTLNFLTLYGGQANKAASLIERAILEQRLPMRPPSIQEVASWIGRHRKFYSGYWSWADAVAAKSRTSGKSVTLGGRIRDLRQEWAVNPSEAGRVAVNHVVQGTAAEVVKRAMVAVFRQQRDPSSVLSRGKMLLQVHDEIVCTCPAEDAAAYAAALAAAMQCVLLGVPIVAEIGFGPNWAEAH